MATLLREVKYGVNFNGDWASRLQQGSLRIENRTWSTKSSDFIVAVDTKSKTGVALFKVQTVVRPDQALEALPTSIQSQVCIDKKNRCWMISEVVPIHPPIPFKSRGIRRGLITLIDEDKRAFTDFLATNPLSTKFVVPDVLVQADLRCVNKRKRIEVAITIGTKKSKSACGVCLDLDRSLTKEVSLIWYCSHFTHAKCAQAWMDVSGTFTCPLCKASFRI
jgi:hypothetical protein